MHPIVTPNPNIQKSVPDTNPPGLSIPDSTLGPARLGSAPSPPQPRLLTRPATGSARLELDH